MKLNFQDNQQPCAIIIGLDDIRGLYAARTLARHNVPVVGIAKDPKSYGSRTNVCKDILFANTGETEVIELLETLGSALNQKAMLIPCLDQTVLLISRHRSRLEAWYHIALPVPDVVEMMMDKVSFYTYAQKEGFPIPQTLFLHSRTDAEKAAKTLPYPCILKPPNSKSPLWLKNTHLKAFKVSNEKEFLAHYDHYHRWTDIMIAQEWVEGTDADLFSCNCYFDANSQPIVTFISRKIRQWPPETGETCLGQECRDDVVLRETVRLFQSVGYYGLGYVELKRDIRTGKYFIMEPNIGRPTARSAIAEASGVELLYAVYCDAIGRPLPANLDQKYQGVKWIHLRRDLQSTLYYWRRGTLTLKEWWRSWRGHKIYALFSWRDPVPFLVDLQRAIRLFLIPQERKKRKSNVSSQQS